MFTLVSICVCMLDSSDAVDGGGGLFVPLCTAPGVSWTEWFSAVLLLIFSYRCNCVVFVSLRFSGHNFATWPLCLQTKQHVDSVLI